MKIISGRSNPALAEKIAVKFALQLSKVEITKYSDGEVAVNIKEQIAGKILLIIQSISKPVNEHLIELLMLIRAAKENKASKVIAVIPYFGYGRGNKKFTEGGVASAKLVADMLDVAGADQILTLDLHSTQILDYFTIPVTNIDLTGLYIERIKFKDNLIIVSPDIGGKDRASKLALILNAELAVMNKERLAGGSCMMHHIDAKVKGKNCLIIDDIIDTGETVVQAANFLQANGATSVKCIATHGVLSNNDVLNMLKFAPLDFIYLTNSINLRYLGIKFEIIDIAEKIVQELQKIL